MTDKLEKYLKGQKPLISEDHRTLQRTALAELIKLSGPAVDPVTSQLDQEHELLQKQLLEEHQKVLASIEKKHHDDSASTQSQYEQGKTKIQSGYDNTINILESRVQDKRESITGKINQQIQKVSRQCQYHSLTSETMADGEINKCKAIINKVNKFAPAAKQLIKQLHEQAEYILKFYHFPVPDMTSDNIEEVSNPRMTYRQQYINANNILANLYRLKRAKMFTGIWPYLLPVIFCGLTVLGIWLGYNSEKIQFSNFSIMAPVAGGAMLIVTLGLGRVIWLNSRKKLKALSEDLRKAVVASDAALQKRINNCLEKLDLRIEKAHEKRKSDLQITQDKLDNTVRTANEELQQELAEIQSQYEPARKTVDDKYNEEIAGFEAKYQHQQQKIQTDYETHIHELHDRYQLQQNKYQDQYDKSYSRLIKRFNQGLACINAMLDDCHDLNGRMPFDWHSMPVIQSAGSAIVRFGDIEIDMSNLSQSVRNISGKIANGKINIPALLAFPDRCNLLLESGRNGRKEAIDTLRAVMLRLLTTIKPGQVNFTIIDPVGLGENFAGFMHASDYLEAMIGGRIWTSPTQIQSQLDDLTDHMEKVIQKYLRNEFETIDQYNEQAGELAEPYRFLVIADFPGNFNEQALKKLTSIVNSGPRCGVYTLIAYDSRTEFPSGFDLADLVGSSIYLKYKDSRFVWQDEIYQQFKLTNDQPPTEDILTEIIKHIGKAAQESSKVEVPFETIAPAADKFWSLKSDDELVVPIGRTGATRLQQLKLGKGMAQHMLIAGKTGSGKSTLFHVMATNLALWYSPDEVEMYLVDFKKGVEFKTYVNNALPHARTVAIESDREFGLSILQKLNEEMTRRGNLFRDQNVQDLKAYRGKTGKKMPRTVLIVDEFQIFFSEDDKLSQDAGVLLEQLVRQGRAFGIHVILGSQTLGGMSGLARSTMGQMAVRVALQCSETDAQMIFDDGNSAARLLARPGEAIYNDAGGMIVGNSPFQISWLSDKQRDDYLAKVRQMALQQDIKTKQMIVFEGNIAADITQNHLIENCLEAIPQQTSIANAWLGDPVAIKDPTAVAFRRQSGANLVIIGQSDESALALMASSMISLSAQYKPQNAKFITMDGSPADAAFHGNLEKWTSLLPHEHKSVPWRDVPDIMNELTIEVQRRHEKDSTDGPAIYLMIFGLQRYRMLRKNDDDFGFSMDEQPKPKPEKQFAEILRDGPAVGVHIIVWSDTLTSLERTLDRVVIREFDNRVLFQMSANDSSNLIDSPAANNLGLHRAIFYSEEHGVLEKFRPYATPENKWMKQLIDKIK
ncbi:MAG: cell division protein FtsK [Phycisphaerae bacterium]|nr:cell division protein FtsK [Phycisphaerae bacterium]